MKRPLEGCLRSEGLTGPRPRKAAMRKCSIIEVVFCYCADGVAPGPRRWAVILIAVFTSSPVAMNAAEGFGFFGAAVDKNGSANHTLLIPPPVWFDNVMVGYMPLVEQMLPSKPGIHLS